MEDYYIALDTGGTKTDAVLFDESGHILSRLLRQGGGPMDIGIPSAGDNTVSVIRELSEKIPGKRRPASVYCSVAGSDYYPGQMDAYVRPRTEAGYLKIWDDGECIITGTLGRQDGGGMIAGTGSCLFVRREERYRRIGGWGYLLDSNGSGYTIGRAALYAVMREADGRGEKTVLTELIGERMGGKPHENIPAIYGGGRRYIASFAGCVFQGRRLGDSVSCRIFDWAVDKLAELTIAGAASFEDEFPIALNGGIFRTFPELAEGLSEKASPKARLIQATVPPLFGAAVEALWNLKIPEPAGFKERFMAEYED